MPDGPQPDIPAPSEWVDHFGDYLFGIAMYRTGNAATAEDLVQETFLRALRGFETFEGKSQFKTWLRGILSHVVSDHFRKAYRDPTGAQLSEELGDIDVESDKQPDALLEKKEVWEALEFCLTQIPAKSAKIFRSIEVDGLSNREIADQQGVSENHVAVLLHRARKALKDCMLNLFKKGKS